MSNSIGVKKIYLNGYARTKSFNNDWRLSKVLKIVNQAIPKPSARILDVGCGDGVFTIQLGKTLKAKEIYGVDIAPKAIREAVKIGIEAKALDVDEKDLPYQSNYFDFIFCGNLIELVFDPDHLLEELYRVLSSRGHLIITFPNLCAWASRLAVLLGFQPYYDLVSRKYDVGKLLMPVKEYKNESKGFVRLYTLHSFTQLTAKYGFKIIKSYGARGEALPKAMTFIDGILSKIPSLAFQIICVAVKE